MLPLAVGCDTSLSDVKVTVAVPVRRVSCSKAMFALSFSTLLSKCLMQCVSSGTAF